MRLLQCMSAIGTKQTWAVGALQMSAFGGKADMLLRCEMSAYAVIANN